VHPANKWLIGVASASLIASTVRWEGMEEYAYTDMANIVTVCSGYTGKDIVLKKKYTKEECNVLTKKELVVHGTGILNCITRPLKEYEYNAFTLFAYNVGVSGACSSRAIRLFNQGRSNEACRALSSRPDGSPAWSYVNNKFIQGLHNRRLFETEMCLGVGYVYTK
jgi:lysozyme